jgi:hypothetical protein
MNKAELEMQRWRVTKARQDDLEDDWKFLVDRRGSTRA